MPYLRAKAGIAFAGRQSIKAKESTASEKNKPPAKRRQTDFTSSERNRSILPPPNAWRQR